MSALRPVAVYGLEIPCNGVAIEANPEDLPANFRITMAAIDPTEEAMVDEDLPAGPPRATLKLIRIPFGAYDDDEDSDEEGSDDDDVMAIERRLGMTSEDDESSGEENGGPGEKTKKARTAALIAHLKQIEEEEKESGLTNGVNGTKSSKGKEKASDDSASDLDSEDEGEDLDIDEYVICTLDANQHYQQTLDITVNEGEQVYFKVIGAYNIHLTGNYFVPNDEIEQSDDDEDSEDDELENALAGYDVEGMSDEEDYSEEDELDDLEDPRIMEIDSEEEAPKLIAAKPAKKGKNKRAAEDEPEEDIPKDILAKILKTEEPVNGESEQKLSKKQKKKLKNNAGDATEAPKVEEKPASKKEIKKESKKDIKKEAAAAKDSTPVNGSGKKVQFAEKLEQGPTPTKADKNQKKGPRVVGGVTIDDRKVGSGPVAKKGDKIAMRYIGKLKDGKVFDSNTKGKAFEFKLGVGEVIKGWDVGVQGMTAGSERRLTIPAGLAYGKQGVKGIPGNSELTFDVKLLSIN